MSLRSPSSRHGVALLIFLVLAGIAYFDAAQVEAVATYPDSPLFQRQLATKLQQMVTSAPALQLAPTLTAPSKQPIRQALLFVSEGLSACIGSGCVASACGGSGCGGSGCAGSACPGSVCGGSACAGSVCGGSACAGSVCGASACGTSVCVGSLCGASACVGSLCTQSVCAGSACGQSLCAGSACGKCSSSGGGAEAAALQAAPGTVVVAQPYCSLATTGSTLGSPGRIAGFNDTRRDGGRMVSWVVTGVDVDSYRLFRLQGGDWVLVSQGTAQADHMAQVFDTGARQKTRYLVEVYDLAGRPLRASTSAQSF